MIIVNQYFGLGDIIWEQTLVKAIADVKPVIWPVMPQFVEGLNRAYPDITFVDMNLLKLDYNRNYEYEFAGAKILPMVVRPKGSTLILRPPSSSSTPAASRPSASVSGARPPATQR